MTDLGITRLDQLHHLIPEQGLAEGETPGDCYRTALACLLRAETPEAVPHFVHQSFTPPSPEFADAPRGWLSTMYAREWLRDHDVDLASFDPEALIEFAATADIPVLGLATVPSRRVESATHAVVWDITNNRQLWDPQPFNRELGDYRPAEVRYLEVFVAPFEPDPVEEVRQLMANGSLDPLEFVVFSSVWIPFVSQEHENPHDAD